VNEKSRKEHRQTERFHQIPIFSDLSGQETGRILRITSERSFATGSEIFKPGDATDAFYIILDGKVEIVLPTPSGKTSIATLSNRSVFGEMSFIGKRPRSAQARALEDTRLQRIDGPAFQDMLDKGDLAAYKVMANFAKLIAGRLRKVEDELVRVLEDLPSDTGRTARLAELQQFRQTLYKDWSF
jgi:CRP/FNR family cyclic AMP-dependent transcriptional regulator